MGCGSSIIEKRKVIVVGGGYAGTAAAKELDGLCDVTLITPNDAMVHKYAYLRACVVPGWEKVTRIPLDKLLKRGKIVYGKVTSVVDGAVTLENGAVMRADSIILAPGYGSSLTSIADSQTFKTKLKENQAAIKNAESILVVGGGPVGVEFSGEVKAQYPTKTVHLVHSQAKLLSNSEPPVVDAMVSKLTSSLKDMGIELTLNAKVSNLPKVDSNGDGLFVGRQTFGLSNGTSVTADVTMVCVGGERQESTLVAADAMDEHKRIIVNDHLQVRGLPSVFCIGDANNVDETKLGYYGTLQAKVAAKNVQHLARAEKMAVYKPANGAEYGPMFIPLGPRRGVGALGSTVLGDFLVRTAKGKGLGKKAMFGAMNVTVPTVS